MDEWMNGFPFTFHLSLFTLPELVAQARECFAFVQCVNPISWGWILGGFPFNFQLSTLTFIKVVIALRSHPFPFRTGSLSSASPMVLHCVVGE